MWPKFTRTRKYWWRLRRESVESTPLETISNNGQQDAYDAICEYRVLVGQSEADALFLLREIDREIPEVWPDGWEDRPSSFAERPEIVEAFAHLLGALRMSTITPAIRVFMNTHNVLSNMQWVLSAASAHRSFSKPSATSQAIQNFIEKGYTSGLFPTVAQVLSSSDEGQ